MDEKDIENLKDLQFTITKEFKELVIEMLTTNKYLTSANYQKKIENF